MTRLWGIGDIGLPAGPFTNLLYLLFLAHGIVGDLSRTVQCFESVLEQPVQLRVVHPLPHAPPVAPPDAQVIVAGGTLSNLALGCDFVLGGDCLEKLPVLEISVCGLSVV
jgi:hypothetical protein